MESDDVLQALGEELDVFDCGEFGSGNTAYFIQENNSLNSRIPVDGKVRSLIPENIVNFATLQLQLLNLSHGLSRNKFRISSLNLSLNLLYILIFPSNSQVQFLEPVGSIDDVGDICGVGLFEDCAGWDTVVDYFGEFCYGEGLVGLGCVYLDLGLFDFVGFVFGWDVEIDFYFVY